MLNHVVVFYGSKKDFEQLLHERIDVGEETVQFMELIQKLRKLKCRKVK